MTGDETVGVVALALLVLLIGVAASDHARGALSWRDWWDRLR
jgi:hypothetical protein